MRSDDRIRLTHIADALENAVSFTEGRSASELDTDVMLRFALLHAIQIAGEAASSMHPDTRDRYPEVPWAAIIGMRHRLVHAYANIDLGILWTTATEAAPKLLQQVRTILESD